jgi:N-glycosylase/DNA lyase
MSWEYWGRYAEDAGIPDEHIDDVLETAEICCGEEGPCAENTRAIIDKAAEAYA